MVQVVVSLLLVPVVAWCGPFVVAEDNASPDMSNPYYRHVIEALEGVEAEPEIEEEFDSCWKFRDLAEKALRAAWAAGSDASPRKGDRVLVERASAFIDFCLKRQEDGSWFYSRSWKNGDPNCDRFTLGPLMDAIWWLRQLPDMEERWQRWEKPLRKAVDFQYKYWGRHDKQDVKGNKAWGAWSFDYANQDVFHLYEMTLAHRWWGDEKYRSSADRTLSALESNLLPDGGFHYIGPETESPVYHTLNLVWLGRYLKLTGDERARRLLKKTRDYYPLTYSNEGYAEHYTDCWWKHYWNDPQPAGPQIIAGLTRDAQHQHLAEQILDRFGHGDSYWGLYAGMFYQEDIEPQPLDDGWLVLDRNIGGPRGRFGNWYFAGVTGGGARDTFVGCMINRNNGDDPRHGALMAANIEVKPGKGGGKRLYLSGHDDLTATEVGDRAAALGARYSLRKPYINHTPGREVASTPWKATQVWLLTKFGLVGVISVQATESKNAQRVRGRLHFGPKSPLERKAANRYRCGELEIRLLDHNFDNVRKEKDTSMRSAPDHDAVWLTTVVDGDVSTERHFRYAAFIRPQDAPEITNFTYLEEWKNGFRVRIGERRYRVMFDPENQSITLK